MPTRRMIDPAFWQSESAANWSRDQRLLFIGLFSNADDQGRLRGSPRVVRLAVFPFDEDIGVEQIKADLLAIEKEGSITLYEVDGKEYIQVTHWWDYQTPQWAYPSKYPAMPGWHDRLRYRQENRVITCNWKPDHSGYTPPPDSPDEPPLSYPPPNGLPKSLGKDLPNETGKDLGGSVRLGLGLEIENKKEIDDREVFAHVSGLYQQEIGPLSPLLADKLLELCAGYPVEWIKLAISGAVEQNVRKFSYVKGTLENWQTEGGPQNDRSRGKSHRPTARAPAGPGNDEGAIKSKKTNPAWPEEGIRLTEEQVARVAAGETVEAVLGFT